jgi:hypothetical protein
MSAVVVFKPGVAVIIRFNQLFTVYPLLSKNAAHSLCVMLCTSILLLLSWKCF